MIWMYECVHGFSDSLPLSEMIRTAYNAGEMWTGTLTDMINLQMLLTAFE